MCIERVSKRVGDWFNVLIECIDKGDVFDNKVVTHMTIVTIFFNIQTRKPCVVLYCVVLCCEENRLMEWVS